MYIYNRLSNFITILTDCSTYVAYIRRYTGLAS